MDHGSASSKSCAHGKFLVHKPALMKCEGISAQKESGSKEAIVTQRNVIFIPSNEEHQFEDVGNERTEF